MSTSKTNQPGDPAGKHVSFTPAQSEAGNASSAGGDGSRSQQQAQSSAGRQPSGASAHDKNSLEGGLETKAKDWLNQQQWLQNIDVNQLSKQAKDLGSKVVDQVNRLSPTQKVVGGALLVSGLSWLALRSSSNKSNRSSAPHDSDNDDTWQRNSESVYRGHMTDS